MLLLFLIPNSLFAQNKVDSLFSELPSKNAEEKIEVYEQLYDLEKYSNPRRAIKSVQHAIRLAEELNKQELLLTLFSKCGNVYYNLGFNFLALQSYYRSLKYAQTEQNEVSVAYCYNDIGNIYYALRNFETARSYYEKSTGFFVDTKDDLGLAVAYNNLGLVEMQEKSYEDALVYFQKAFKLRSIHGPIYLLAHSRLYICQALTSLGNYEGAIEQLSTAYKLYGELNQPNDQAKALYLMGETYLASKEYSKAEEKYLEALEIFESQNNQIRKVYTNLSLATLQMEMNNYAKAFHYANITLEQSISHNLFEYKSEAYKILATISFQQNKPKEAYQFRLLYDQVKDSILLLNRNEKFSNLQFSVETHQKQIENERLNSEIQKQKLERNYFLVILLLTVLLLIILVNRFRLKRKQDQLIFEQKEEITRLEIQKKEEENMRLNRQLEFRNRELTTKTMGIIKNGEFIGGIVQELQRLEVKKENQKTVQLIIEKLKNNLKEDSWKEFEIRFAKVYKDFYAKLTELFPDLTPNERKLCAFLRLNMTTKEISSITYQSHKSIDVARSRLRKKMNLPREENLITYLSKF